MLMEIVSEADVTLTTAMHWVEMKPLDRSVVTVTGRLEGEGREDEGAALLVVEFDIPIASQEELDNSGLYLSEKFGPFAYVQANEGADGKFSVLFAPPSGRIPRRIGLRLFRCEHPVQLLDLTITHAASTQQQHSTRTPLDTPSTAVPVGIEVLEPMLSLVPTNAQITLTTKVHWVELAPPGATIVTVAGRLVGDGREIEGAAILVVEFNPKVTDANEISSTGLSFSGKFGAFSYVQADGSRPGNFSLSFSPPGDRTPCRLGLRLFGCDSPLELLDLTIAVSSPHQPGTAPNGEGMPGTVPQECTATLEGPSPPRVQSLPGGEILWLDLPDTIGNLIEVAATPTESIGSSSDLCIAIELDRFPKNTVLTENGLASPTVQCPFINAPVRAVEPNGFQAKFSIPDGRALTRVGLFCNSGTDRFADASLSRAIFSPVDGKVLVNISIDVEALPGRATSDHVAKLIYGRTDGGEYGVPLQMRVFREMAVPATFYLECGQSAVWSPEAISDVGKLILDTGFDLQLHLHSELVARAHGWKWTKPVPPTLNNLDRTETFRAMGFAIEHFYKMAGRLPEAFRAGSYLFGPHTIEALDNFGVIASSNYRADQRLKNAFDFDGDAPMRPFRWSNGALEFPITLSPEPLSALTPRECWRRILHHVQANRTWVVNVVLHSWSFMHRDADGHHVWRGSDLMDNLIKFIELAPAGVRFASIAEIAEAAHSGNMEVPLEKDIAALVSRQT